MNGAKSCLRLPILKLRPPDECTSSNQSAVCFVSLNQKSFVIKPAEIPNQIEMDFTENTLALMFKLHIPLRWAFPICMHIGVLFVFRHRHECRERAAIEYLYLRNAEHQPCRWISHKERSLITCSWHHHGCWLLASWGQPTQGDCSAPKAPKHLTWGGQPGVACSLGHQLPPKLGCPWPH